MTYIGNKNLINKIHSHGTLNINDYYKWVRYRNFKPVIKYKTEPSDDFICEGPWKWIKITFDPGELNDPETLEHIFYTDIYYIGVYYNYDVSNISEYFDGYIENSLTYNENDGEAYSSSFYSDEYDSFEPKQPFLESNNWIADFSDDNPWLAYKFNEEQLFNYVYIVFEDYSSFIEYGGSPLTGGHIYVSNNSTNGIDGEWNLLKTNVFNNNDCILNYNTCKIALCDDSDTSVFSEIECSGPWLWFKLKLPTIELVGPNDELENIAVISNISIYYMDSGNLVESVGGTAFSSSNYTIDGISASPDNAFNYSEEEEIPYWISAIDDPDPWIAFKFNTLTEFDWCYIRSILFGWYGSMEYYTSGGDIYASLDSTNGIDGTWQLLREDIFNINYDDYGDRIQSLYVPICSVDPVEPEESTPAR